MAHLSVTRAQILAYRRRVGGLDERLPRGRRSMRRAAWAGLQDSMPRAALLSLHARIRSVGSTVLDDPSLVQLWGPRFSVYVVAERDRAVFSLGRLSEGGRKRQIGEELADRLDDLLDGAEMPFGEAGRLLGVPPNRLRYAAPTGRVLVRWDGATQPLIWTVPRPDVDPRRARLELARRYLHVFGPTTAAAFSGWAGIARRQSEEVFHSLRRSLIPVRTPIGPRWMLGRDEAAIRTAPGSRGGPARLLPSGDTYFLLHGDDRTLLVTEANRRSELWTSRVWPGAVLVGGRVVGTWRRAGATLTITPWRRLGRRALAALEDEAASLPLPGSGGPVKVTWAA